MKNQERGNQIDNNSGIYKFASQCNSVYIGKTSRKFKQRIHEHYNSFLNNTPERSNFAAHLLQPTHQLTPFTNNFQVLKIINEKRYIQVWEEI